VADDEADADGIDATPATLADTEFVLATQLEEFLLGHWSAVDWGRRLSLWQGPDGTRGHQLSTPLFTYQVNFELVPAPEVTRL
jgi:hypothetical protein